MPNIDILEIILFLVKKNRTTDKTKEFSGQEFMGTIIIDYKYFPVLPKSDDT